MSGPQSKEDAPRYAKTTHHEARKPVGLSPRDRETFEDRIRQLEREERRLLVSKDEVNRKTAALQMREVVAAESDRVLKEKETRLRAHEETLSQNAEALERLAEGLKTGTEERRIEEKRLKDAERENAASKDEAESLLNELRKTESSIADREGGLAESHEGVALLQEEQRMRGQEQEAKEWDLREKEVLLRERERDVEAREARVRLLTPLLARWSLSAQDEEARFHNPESLAGLPLPENAPSTLKVAKTAVLQEVRELRRRQETLETQERELATKLSIVEKREREARDDGRRAFGWRAQVYGLERG